MPFHNLWRTLCLKCLKFEMYRPNVKIITDMQCGNTTSLDYYDSTVDLTSIEETATTPFYNWTLLNETSTHEIHDIKYIVILICALIVVSCTIASLTLCVYRRKMNQQQPIFTGIENPSFSLSAIENCESIVWYVVECCYLTTIIMWFVIYF